MKTIRVVEEYRRCMEVKMHMKVWTVIHKEQVDPGENMLLIVRILDSEKQQPAPEEVDADDRRTKITFCNIDNFISGTDDARKIARGPLFSVISSDGDAYEWSATLPFLEVELFQFCYQAASTMKDYIEATRYEYGDIQVLVDISRPSSRKQQDLENISRVCDNFERVEDASTAESSNYNRKDGGICKYCREPPPPISPPPSPSPVPLDQQRVPPPSPPPLISEVVAVAGPRYQVVAVAGPSNEVHNDMVNVKIEWTRGALGEFKLGEINLVPKR